MLFLLSSSCSALLCLYLKRNLILSTSSLSQNLKAQARYLNTTLVMLEKGRVGDYGKILKA